ncbi:MAG: beta-N-acetylhexosaminidase, partial [Chitinophagaceae bacterium]
MRYCCSLAYLLAGLMAISACTNNTSETKESTPPTLADLIPKPVEVKPVDGVFELQENTVIRIAPGNPALQKIGGYLASALSPATGLSLKIDSGAAPKNAIGLNLVNDIKLGNEGYELKITKEGIDINANNPAGIFYGIQTIRQLLPASIEQSQRQKNEWRIATGTIRDYPDYAMRGAMLDVARHFFEVEDVRRYIDLLAYYKMNTLHLHLSDDQGWRIEIKKWPRLTEFGSTSEVGGGKGGFYTQEQYKELVQYAADRFITIIPEIDMPGHTNAALASYPELNCNEKDKSPKLYTGTEVGFSTLCTKNEKVYQFVQDVLGELAAITPGPYLHIGGDESHVTKKE